MYFYSCLKSPEFVLLKSDSCFFIPEFRFMNRAFWGAGVASVTLTAGICEANNGSNTYISIYI